MICIHELVSPHAKIRYWFDNNVVEPWIIFLQIVHCLVCITGALLPSQNRISEFFAWIYAIFSCFLPSSRERLTAQVRLLGRALSSVNFSAFFKFLNIICFGKLLFPLKGLRYTCWADSHAGFPCCPLPLWIKIAPQGTNVFQLPILMMLVWTLWQLSAYLSDCILIWRPMQYVK